MTNHSRNLGSQDLGEVVAFADKLTTMLDEQSFNAYQIMNLFAMLSVSLVAASTPEHRQRLYMLQGIHEMALSHLRLYEEGEHGKA